MRRAVSKFGGSSLADRDCIRRVAALVKSTPTVRREHHVLSAPGQRNSDDIKVTDLLLSAAAHVQKDDLAQYDATIATIASRYQGLTSSPLPALDKALSQSASQLYDMRSSPSAAAFAASRGEYLNGMVMAHETGFEFVDPADEFIVFDENRTLDAERTLMAIRHRVGDTWGSTGVSGYVIPGFFGSVNGVANDPLAVQTFSRGGSDVTASLVAAALADEELENIFLPSLRGGGLGVTHENFTDVDGVFNADPRLCPNATRIPILSYNQTRALAVHGASVLHPDAVTPLVPRNVTIHVRSTWEVEHEGTWVSKDGALLEWDNAYDGRGDGPGRRLARAAALAVTSTDDRVTVVCKEAEDEERRKAVRQAVHLAMVSAIFDGASGIGALPVDMDATSDPLGLAVSVRIADPAVLGTAVRAVFDRIIAEPA